MYFLADTEVGTFPPKRSGSMERPDGSGLRSGIGGNWVIPFFFLSFTCLTFINRDEGGRGELRHLASSPNVKGVIKVLSYSNYSEYSKIKQQQQQIVLLATWWVLAASKIRNSTKCLLYRNGLFIEYSRLAFSCGRNEYRPRYNDQLILPPALTGAWQTFTSRRNPMDTV